MSPAGWCSTIRRGARALRRTAPALATAACLLGGSCKYGEVVVMQPAATGRGQLTLSIQVDPEDSAVTRELGWSRGIPGAEVTISPGNADTATGSPVAVLRTDTLGIVSVADLSDGTYLVEVRRLLSAEEVADLAAGEDVVGFMARELVTRGSAIVSVPTSRRGSLVISEWAFQPLWTQPGVGWYSFGGYLKLENNGDTTVYLDGLVIGEGFYGYAYDLVPGVCANYEPQSNDSQGVWTRYFDSLPGTGRDHPLAPGATAIIATDAIDHSGIAPGGLDLSHADFDFVGTSDVSSPGVPRTVSIGLAAYWGGHGLYLNHIDGEVIFIALPVNVASLPQTPNHYVERIPRARILDVMAQYSTYESGHPLCQHLVNSVFDRHAGRFGPVGGGNSLTYADEGDYSVQRKVALVRSDGRKILQHTRTTRADFFYGLRTLAHLP